jgi:Holliday junction resolvasome RuvABC DNA-binding subunit
MLYSKQETIQPKSPFHGILKIWTTQVIILISSLLFSDIQMPLKVKKAASSSAPSVPAHILENLTSMGFTEKQVTKALKNCVSYL